WRRTGPLQHGWRKKKAGLVRLLRSVIWERQHFQVVIRSYKKPGQLFGQIMKRLLDDAPESRALVTYPLPPLPPADATDAFHRTDDGYIDSWRSASKQADQRSAHSGTFNDVYNIEPAGHIGGRRQVRHGAALFRTSSNLWCSSPATCSGPSTISTATAARTIWSRVLKAATSTPFVFRQYTTSTIDLAWTYLGDWQAAGRRPRDRLHRPSRLDCGSGIVGLVELEWVDTLSTVDPEDMRVTITITAIEFCKQTRAIVHKSGTDFRQFSVTESRVENLEKSMRSRVLVARWTAPWSAGSEHIRTRRPNMGNFMLPTSCSPRWQADFVLVNSGSFRADCVCAAGDFRLGDHLSRLFPMLDPLWVSASTVRNACWPPSEQVAGRPVALPGEKRRLHCGPRRWSGRIPSGWVSGACAFTASTARGPPRSRVDPSSVQNRRDKPMVADTQYRMAPNITCLTAARTANGHRLPLAPLPAAGRRRGRAAWRGCWRLACKLKNATAAACPANEPVDCPAWVDSLAARRQPWKLLGAHRRPAVPG
uniref:DUF2263 domain-containing protein n=1 Tax=Macrostomum lignano TaxID=282301 RepID=A0A1I8F908_9PLAT